MSVIKTVLFENYLSLQDAARDRGWLRWRPLRKLSGSMYRRLRCGEELTMTCRGLAWTLDADDPYFTRSLVIEGTHEPYETEYFLGLLLPGMTVVDVGAHVGWYTLLAAQRVGPAGRVIAFEPEPANYARLERNVAASGYRHVITVPKAVAERTRALTLFRDPGNSGGHSIADCGNTRPAFTVEAVALDEYFGPEPPPVHVIKIDVEGAECLAWRGMQRVLQRNPDLVLMMEFSPQALSQAGSSPEELWRMYCDAGFKPFRLHGETQRLLPVEFDELLHLCERGDRHTNLFLSRHQEPQP
ncbi:MAG: hypothetical protein COV75_03380 [Candidatus Omnitrophica bacterium CG11_big_fil_rev_8_21_14_0_20_63_9]|nr:MAG: hypothetical protein COV75_03380 [Candidatus Omnitrophica bacterium CG11_big_fil_rev_8_21_14_0_20_63_9]